MTAILTTKELILPIYELPDNSMFFRNQHLAREAAIKFSTKDKGTKIYFYVYNPQPDMGGKLRLTLAATFLNGTIQQC